MNDGFTYRCADPRPGDVVLLRMSNGEWFVGEVASCDSAVIALGHAMAMVVMPAGDGSVAIGLAPACVGAERSAPLVLRREHVSAWAEPDPRMKDRYTQARAASSGIVVPGLVVPGQDGRA